VTLADVKRIRARWRRSPVLFVQDVWAPKFRDQQKAVLECFGEKSTTRKVAWRAYRGSGKTTVEAWLTLWHPLVWDDAVTITTSGTWRQVTTQQWREVDKQFRLAKQRGWALGPDPLKTRWEPIPGNMAIGVSSKLPGNLEGYHSRHVFVIFDEAKVVADAVFKATFGYEQSAESVRALAASAAGKNVGFFFDRFKAKGWKPFHSDGELSPDCSREWIEMMARELGEDSPFYRAQVKAEFYEEDANTLIPYSLLDLARAGGGDDCEVKPGDKKSLGIDVGAGGDLSSLCGRHGPRFFVGQTLKREDTTETLGAAIALHRQHHFDRATVDATGVGKGVADMLAKEKLRVVKYFAGGTMGVDSERFRMRRDQDAWGLRQRFADGHADCSDLPEPFWVRLAGQANSIRIVRNPRGQYCLEAKDAYKRRVAQERGPEFAHSPDEFDSAVMCNAELGGPPPAIGIASATPRK
jgi:hypothetical protein